MDFTQDFTYQASGGIEIFGCSGYKHDITRHYLFSIGSIVYSKPQALMGVLYKIAIKDIRFPKPYVNLYVDTFNALWNENELVSYETALSLIQRHTEIRNAEMLEAAKLCK